MHDVHRAVVGQSLNVGRLGGAMGVGVVKEISADQIRFEVALREAPPAPLPVTLLLAMPRPKCFRRVIQCATTMGVKRIALFGAYRVEKSYWKTPWLEEAALREQMVLGLEQARDTRLPVITLHPLFKPFIEDDMPKLVQGARCIVAHPGVGSGWEAKPEGRFVVAIGPEGGFTSYEVDQLMQRGFEAVELGSRILRTEQAVPALLGRFL